MLKIFCKSVAYTIFILSQRFEEDAAKISFQVFFLLKNRSRQISLEARSLSLSLSLSSSLLQLFSRDISAVDVNCNVVQTSSSLQKVQMHPSQAAFRKIVFLGLSCYTFFRQHSCLRQNAFSETFSPSLFLFIFCSLFLKWLSLYLFLFFKWLSMYLCIPLY